MGVYMQGEVNYAALSYFALQAMSEVLLAMTNALQCTRAKKFAHMMSTNRPATLSRKSCHVCHAKPSVFESFAGCASCNMYARRKCRCKERVLALDLTSGCQLTRAEFCSVCISTMNLSSLAQIRLEGQGHEALDVKDEASIVSLRTGPLTSKAAIGR